jgi:ATP-dependent Clp protease protease subunit
MNISEKIVVENSNGRGEYSLSGISAAEGIITIAESITGDVAMELALLLSRLAKEEKDITLLINSYGGEVNAGLVMYDLIQSYPYGVDIYCTGIAASMAAIILAGGRKGHRFVLPHSSVMIHEPLIAAGFGGSATTIEHQAQSILETRTLVNGILAKHTGKTIKEINKATAFDNFMSASQAIEFGICDKIASIF